MGRCAKGSELYRAVFLSVNIEDFLADKLKYEAHKETCQQCKEVPA